MKLHLAGSGSLIKSIRPEQIQVKLDLKRAVAGANTFTVEPEDITLPPGVFLRKVEPPAVEVTLDVPIKKELPVQVDWVGKLPEHLILTEAHLDPPRIWIIGVKTIYTEKVPLDNIRKTGTITANLVLEPASLMIAPGSKDKVTVTYVTEERSR